eukprot:TRINITY_DN63360_c0_g1_i1.p1 TRINITY_DN63360_c0_g1~~TRINITY_DN63360_c0_g1_i1.p1  ORF type:complete len:490 (-),score=87.63 TRINITY_DN63360_c0_g1_i1:408-1877(-)
MAFVYTCNNAVRLSMAAVTNAQETVESNALHGLTNTSTETLPEPQTPENFNDRQPKNSCGILRRMWSRCSKALEPYFFATGGNDGYPEDNLVEVVRQDPTAAASLLQSVALFSAAGSLVSGSACSAFLLAFWDGCGNCDRPLRWWLLIQAVLQFSQVPVRVVLLICARSVEASGQSMEAFVQSLTASPAWRLSKKVALIQYGWFVLGMVWWMHTDTCPTCPAITKLVAAVMFLSAARAVAALAVFRALFRGNAAGNGDEAPKMVGATANQIATLTQQRWEAPAKGSSDDDDDEQASCSICLCEFTDGVIVRRLPCGHHFHRRCVDKWLQRNKRCPLCMHPVDQECKWAADPSPAAAPCCEPVQQSQQEELDAMLEEPAADAQPVQPQQQRRQPQQQQQPQAPHRQHRQQPRQQSQQQMHQQSWRQRPPQPHQSRDSQEPRQRNQQQQMQNSWRQNPHQQSQQDQSSSSHTQGYQSRYRRPQQSSQEREW